MYKMNIIAIFYIQNACSATNKNYSIVGPVKGTALIKLTKDTGMFKVCLINMSR